MSEIGIITNPHAKLNKRNPKRQKILSYIAGKQGVLKITNDIKDLKLAAQEFYEQKISVLAINGGDGTISRTITAFIEVYGNKPLPRICILPGGTINTLAKNLGISGGPEKNLYKLIESHRHGEKLDSVGLHTIQVEGYFGFLFANGICSNFLKEFYRKKTNVWGSIFLFLKTVISFIFRGKLFQRVVNCSNFRLLCEKEVNFKHKTCTILCSTTPCLPLGVPFFDQLELHQDKFQCVSIISSLNNFVLRVVPKILLGYMKVHDQDKYSSCFKKLEIIGEKNFTYTVDGELFESTKNKIELSLGPKLNFITNE